MTPRAPDDQPLAMPALVGELTGLLQVEEVGSLTDGELADALTVLVDAASRLEARLCQVAAAFDARAIHAADGHKTAAAWLAARTEITRPHASALVHRGRDLRSCPHVEVAYRSGVIGTDKVRLLLKARDRFPAPFATAAQTLVEFVAPLSVAHAAVVLERWLAINQAEADLADADARRDDPHAGDGEGEGDADGDAAEEGPPATADGQPGSTCHLSTTLGGRVLGDLDLDAVDGAELLGHVDAWIDRQFQVGTYRADDGMVRSQRIAQALLALTARGANPNATRHGEVRPSVTVTVDHRTLHGIALRSVDELPLRSCNLDNGPAVPLTTVERLLCTARIQVAAIRLRTDGTIETVGETDERRHPNRRQRRALERRDRGCTFPGCAAPPSWCDAHHLIPYDDGGPTLLANLTLLCKHHHHTVHEGGWKMRRARDGTLRLARPDGTPVPVPPHGTRLR